MPLLGNILTGAGLSPKRRLEPFLILFGGVLLALLVACAPDQANVMDGQESGSEPSEVQTLLENPDRIGFAEVSQWAFKSSCNQCHNSQVASGGINLESFESLMASKVPNLIMLGEPLESRLYTALEAEKGSRQMPPTPEQKLSEAKRRLVFEWISRGAPERAGELQAFLSLKERLTPYFNNPETIDYQVVKEWVFQPGRCYTCHSRDGYRADTTAILFGADMTRYSNFFLVNAIVSGQPEDTHNPAGEITSRGSQIYESVANRQSMPPADEGYFPLSEMRVKLLRLWILNCAIKVYTPGNGEQLLKAGEGAEKVRNCY